MTKPKLYLAMIYRGVDGENASKETMAHNREIAREVGGKIQAKFPEIDVIIPHIDHRMEIYNIAYDRGFCSIDDILGACCLIVTECQIFCSVGGVSEGMKVEEITARHKGLEIVCIDRWEDEDRFEKIANAIGRVMYA